MIRLYLILFLQEAKAEEEARREEQEAQVALEHEEATAREQEMFRQWERMEQQNVAYLKKKREEFEEANRMRREQEREQLAGYSPHLLNPLTEEEEIQLISKFSCS